MRGILLAENLPDSRAKALHQRDPAMAVRRVGDGIAPSVGMPDPELLVWIEESDFLLVTNNRRSMPIHLAAHLAGHRQIPGIIQVPKRYLTGMLADYLVLLFGVSLPGELDDHITHI